MQLELKHLAPYLPYGLKGKMVEGDSIYDVISIDIYGNLDILSENKFDNDNIGIEGLKPILRPLSDLTREIEHNKENVVPIIDLLKIKNPPPKDNKSRYGLIEISSSGYPEAYYRFRANYNIMVNWITRHTG